MRKYIIARVIKKLKAISRQSYWIAPDGKVFDASFAGHQDWIDTHEEFLVKNKYLTPEEIDKSSIEYMVYERDWIRVTGGVVEIRRLDKKNIRRIERLMLDEDLDSLEFWENDINIGEYSRKDVLENGLDYLLKKDLRHAI